MELVLNIWPIVDSQSQLIQRFAARAYALAADDSTICATLKALANSDFALARQFPIPKRFTYVTSHGPLEGVITIAAFNENESAIIEDAMRTFETKLPPLHGVGIDPAGHPFHQRIEVTFPTAPYCVVTFLIEEADGILRVFAQ